MKKAIAALLAILCVAGAGTFVPVSGGQSAAVLTASAATTVEEVEPGINAEKYKYQYADTSVYAHAISLVSGTDWVDEKSSNKYGIYKVVVTGVEEGKKVTVDTQYCIGLAAIKNTAMDVVANETITVPDSAMEKFNALKDAPTLTNEDKVTLIADNAFKSSYLKTIDLTGIEYIGKNAFASCQYITEIDIPASVKYVGDSAFASSGLKTLNVKNEMPVIPASLCASTNLTSITFAYPQYIRNIGASAFKSTPVEAPIFQNWGDAAGYETLIVGDNAYDSCTAIKSVKMPASLKGLGKNVFKSCTSLTDITFGKNTLYADASCFEGCISLSTINFNNVLEGLGGGVFKGCTSLKTVSGFPKTIQNWVEISASSGYGWGNNMFAGCTSLVSVDYPASVTEIPSGTFSGCTALTSVYKGTKTDGASDSTITFVDNNAFTNCKVLRQVNYPNVTEIGSSSFSGCTALESFKVGKCTSVGASALSGCTTLKEITLLSDSYGDSVFSGCSGATVITINSVGMEKTPNSLFSGCTALTEVKDPEKKTALDEVTIMSPSTFANCSSLVSINLPALRILEDSAFSGCSSLKSISDSGNAIKAENYGNKCFYGCEQLDVEVSGDIYTIGTSAFQKSAITKVSINGMAGGTVVIGNSAFADCPSLTEATIMAGDAAKFSVGTALFANDTGLVKAKYQGYIITQNMFKGCTALQDINTSATSIKSGAFEGCTSLTELKTLDGSASTIASDIGGTAFKGCTSLTKIPADLNTVYDGTQNFSGCASLQSVEMKALTTGMFADCTSLKKVTLSEINAIPNTAFQNCTSLTDIDLSEMQSIGTNAFNNTGLKSLTIKNAASIGASAFTKCNELKTIDVAAVLIDKNAFQNDVTLETAVISADTISASAFSGCTALTAAGLTLRNTDAHTLTEVGSNAFSNCTSLTAVAVPGNPKINSKAFGYSGSKKTADFIVAGEADSTVQTYAEENGFEFQLLSDFDPGQPATEKTTEPATEKTTEPATEPAAEVKKGDVDNNGSIDILDVITINRAILGKEVLTAEQTKAADINENGAPDAADALTIMKSIVGLVTL